jgi:hypothetical protein
MSNIVEFLINLHGMQTERFASYGGEYWFLIETLALGYVLCFHLIPWTTDLMVNASAGLAGKYFGNKSRTLVINASTNNPELANMAVAFTMRKAGGVANPLGSNLANIYLMYIVAPAYLLLKWKLKGDSNSITKFKKLIAQEKKLIFQHVSMAFMMFAFSLIAFWTLTASHPFGGMDNPKIQPGSFLLVSAIICVIGIVAFQYWNKKLQDRDPELFEDIDDDDETDSWFQFIGGTAGIILCSFAVNWLFLAWTEVYKMGLTSVLGVAIFTGLHYFVGAIITSLPEMNVATNGYSKLTRADLNTALSAASVSNMTNLAIAVLGILVIIICNLIGFDLTL